MAKKPTKEGFGEVGPGEVISPLSFQRTDEGVDSLHQDRPTGGDLREGPKDPAGFIPKCVGISGRDK